MFSYYTFQRTNNKGAEQTVHMHRLVCAFVVHNDMQQSLVFSSWDPYVVGTHGDASIEHHNKCIHEQAVLECIDPDKEILFA